MTQWLPASIIALLSFGLWGWFSKLSLFYIDSKSALIFQTIGVLLVGLFTLGILNFKPVINSKGIAYGLLTGLAYGVGCLFYLFAANKGKITTVVTLTSLYPFVTIFLSCLWLNESIHFKQWLGILFALLAIILMST